LQDFSSWVRLGVEHATRRPGESAWTVETLVGTADGEYAGSGLSATSAADGSVYLAHQYQDTRQGEATSELRVEAIAPDGQHTTEVVDAGRANGLATSIAVQQDGAVHVAWAYCGPSCGETTEQRDLDASILYATNDSGDWVVETVGEPGSSREKPSIAFDPDGQLWIAYEDVDRQGLWVARRTAGGWEEQEVDPGHFAVGRVHLAIDPAGSLHIVYVVSEDAYLSNEVRYATNAGGAWRTLPIDDTAANEPVLALDRQGRPVIGYTRPTRSDVVVARTDGIDSDCDGQDL